MKYINAFFRTRVDRRTFILGNLFLFFLFFGIPFSALVIGLQLFDKDSASKILAISVALLLVPFMVLFFSLQVRRWHDIGKSGLWMMLGGIPYVGLVFVYIYLSIEQGGLADNRYGRPTDKTRGLFKNIFSPEDTSKPSLVFPDKSTSSNSVRINLSNGVIVRFGQLDCTENELTVKTVDGETKIERKRITDISIRSWLILNYKIHITYNTDEGHKKIELASGTILSTNILTTINLFNELRHWKITGEILRSNVYRSTMTDRIPIIITFVGMFAVPYAMNRILGNHGIIYPLLEFYFGGTICGVLVSIVIAFKAKQMTSPNAY